MILKVRVWSRDTFEKLGLLADCGEPEIGKTGKLWNDNSSCCLWLVKEKVSLRHVSAVGELGG